MLNLRDYQQDLIEQARARIRARVHSFLIQSPTGSGKTVLMAKMLQTAASRGYASWFCVHRRELIKQSVVTLVESAGLDVGIVAASFPGDRSRLVQVCSIGTLRNRRALLQRPKLIIWDEAHHLAAGSWSTIFDDYPDAVHIGLTATPERLDGTGLGKWFKDIIPGPSVSWLIKHGYLCDYKLFAPPPPDLEGVHTLGGDYNKKELAAAMNKSTVTGDVITHYKQHAMGKRMVLFAWSVESSKMLAQKFNDAGIASEHVDGDTPEAQRDATIERFRSGECKVMTNVDLFGEGFDVPAMEAVALLRPTQSLALNLQQVGRALRPFPGKDYAIILDHAGNCRRFGLPDDERTWSLEGRPRRRGQGDVPIRQCPQCYAVSPVSADRCKHCGFTFLSYGRGIEEVEGNLVEVDTMESRAEKRDRELREQASATTIDELTRLAQYRGYKNPEKWAHKIFASREAKKAARDAARFASGMGPFKII